MKAISIYKDNEQRDQAKNLYLTAKRENTPKAWIDWLTFKNNCLNIQLQKYKAHKLDEMVYDPDAESFYGVDDFPETVGSVIAGIESELADNDRALFLKWKGRNQNEKQLYC